MPTASPGGALDDLPLHHILLNTVEGTGGGHRAHGEPPRSRARAAAPLKIRAAGRFGGEEGPVVAAPDGGDGKRLGLGGGGVVSSAILCTRKEYLREKWNEQGVMDGPGTTLTFSLVDPTC